MRKIKKIFQMAIFSQNLCYNRKRIQETKEGVSHRNKKKIPEKSWKAYKYYGTGSSAGISGRLIGGRDHQ